MKLLKQKCTREGFEDYTDLYLVWKHNDKIYSVRVRPVFGRDNKVLQAQAQQVPNDEPFEKYL